MNFVLLNKKKSRLVANVTSVRLFLHILSWFDDFIEGKSLRLCENFKGKLTVFVKFLLLFVLVLALIGAVVHL